MSADADKILREALNLSSEDRAKVLERLLATFQEPSEPDRLWVQEAENRLDAYFGGEMGTASAEDCLCEGSIVSAANQGTGQVGLNLSSAEGAA